MIKESLTGFNGLCLLLIGQCIGMRLCFVMLILFNCEKHEINKFVGNKWILHELLVNETVELCTKNRCRYLSCFCVHRFAFNLELFEIWWIRLYGPKGQVNLPRLQFYRYFDQRIDVSEEFYRVQNKSEKSWKICRNSRNTRRNIKRNALCLTTNNAFDL